MRTESAWNPGLLLTGHRLPSMSICPSACPPLRCACTFTSRQPRRGLQSIRPSIRPSVCLSPATRPRFVTADGAPFFANDATGDASFGDLDGYDSVADVRGGFFCDEPVRQADPAHHRNQ
jgi:hypothetical protein